ncbi:MAG: 30S ribosomal protein S17 [Deltaproteobacteria bacterium]|nr:30S ribosomal protein S17 [Deltaproteobacteria bacterium]
MISADPTNKEPTAPKASPKLRQGKVVKAKMQKSVVVEVTRRVKHPKYVKYVNERACYLAHDQSGECKAGDIVIIEETRPISKLKRWRIKEIVQRETSV